MAEQVYAKPGDLLEYRCPKFGIVWQWRVLSVCLGTERQESLIEIAPVMAKPGQTIGGDLQPTVWVPEPLTRQLKVVRVSEAVEQDDDCGRGVD